ncbi:MAG: DUF3592 domain-containing protein, partial [Myxococcales bacterium]|nr:DUF3592 domain-containing protein [Myxococcales bacterium]
AAPLVMVAMAVQIHEGRESLAWPSRRATVERYRVTKHTSSSSKRKRRSVRYHVEIDYRFEVDGHTYRSHRYSVGQTWWHSVKRNADAHAWAKHFVAKHPTITIYYDPAYPPGAVFKRGTSGGLYAALFGAPIIGGVGWIFLRGAIMEGRKKGRARPHWIGAIVVVVVLWALASVALLLL